MSDKETDPAANKGELAPRADAARNLAGISSAADLLSKAFSALPEEQRQEVVKKAAEAGLEIQVTKAHYEVERQEVDERLDLAGRAAGMVQQRPDAKIQYEDEIRRRQGSTRISVSSKEPEKSGFCFVATTCFGNYDHPTVKVLRQFRDRELKSTVIGSSLVSVYYQYGRLIARLVDKFPALKPLLRKGLDAFANYYRKRTRGK